MSLLIITSTVNVNSNLTVLIDPDVRLKQYISSILFYINAENVESIIICDNSGYDYSKVPELIELCEKKSKKIEFLYFLSDIEKTFKYGKGYGEGEIMTFIHSHSILYKKATSFFKVTGRIIISNIDTVIKFTSSKKNSFQRISFNSFKQEKKIDTRFYHVQIDDFETYLLNSYKKVNDNQGFYLEHSFYKSIFENKMKFSFFYILPFIKGISGSSGVSYEIPKRNFIIRSVANLFLNILNRKF